MWLSRRRAAIPPPPPLPKNDQPDWLWLKRLAPSHVFEVLLQVTLVEGRHSLPDKGPKLWPWGL